MNWLDWTGLFSLALLWGSSFFFNRVALEDLPALTIVLLRTGIAMPVLWAAVILSGHFSGRRLASLGALWPSFLVMGAFANAIPFALIVWGQQWVSASLAAILNATVPLFAVPAAGLALADERMSARKLIGAFTGFSGVVVMIGWEALSGLGVAVWAQIAIVGAALAYAIANVFGRRFRALGVDPIVAAAGQTTAATCLLAPIAFIAERPWSLPAPSVESWLSVLALALLSTALAYGLYFAILERVGAVNMSLVAFLVPLSAICLGVSFQGDRLAWADISGMMLIAFGLAIIDGRILRALRARSRI